MTSLSSQREPELSHDPREPVLNLNGKIISLSSPKVMGIVNVTPDSFSGDGLDDNHIEAVRQGLDMFEAGAEFVDVGGESTRPGAHSVTADEEICRTRPVVEGLALRGSGHISIDTMKPAVAEAAIEAGASIVNDVSGLRDREMVRVVAEHGASVIIMHMQGTPGTMQENPTYEDVVDEVIEYLRERVHEAEKAGVPTENIMVDPGIGFGKTLEHNLEILARLDEFRTLGRPIVIGVSRKSFIGRLSGRPPEDRLGGSISAALISTLRGANIVRTHDVAETCQALQVAQRILERE
jgi:dihydropteroate synthase